MKYLFALMDDQTRFWIAQEVADTKFTADVRPLFQLAKQITGNNQELLSLMEQLTSTKPTTKNSELQDWKLELSTYDTLG